VAGSYFLNGLFLVPSGNELLVLLVSPCRSYAGWQLRTALLPINAGLNGSLR
jgi:hypothetical protein